MLTAWGAFFAPRMLLLESGARAALIGARQLAE
jgi:hypothetical protein